MYSQSRAWQILTSAVLGVYSSYLEWDPPAPSPIPSISNSSVELFPLSFIFLTTMPTPASTLPLHTAAHLFGRSVVFLRSCWALWMILKWLRDLGESSLQQSPAGVGMPPWATECLQEGWGWPQDKEEPPEEIRNISAFMIPVSGSPLMPEKL